VPLRLSVQHFGQTVQLTDPKTGLLTSIRIEPEQEDFFHQELRRIEMERSPNSSAITSQWLNAERNVFTLMVIISWSGYLNDQFLETKHKKFFDEALERSPENMKLARAEWEWFVETFYTQMGRPLPDWPIYIEIQEGLRIDRNSYQRLARVLKAQVYWLLKKAFGGMAKRYPSWRWAREQHCYYSAGLLEKYIFPSGGYSCLTGSFN
jgi:hypothetical protein